MFSVFCNSNMRQLSGKSNIAKLKQVERSLCSTQFLTPRRNQTCSMMHLISAQTSQEEIIGTKAKKHLRSYCPNIYCGFEATGCKTTTTYYVVLLIREGSRRKLPVSTSLQKSLMVMRKYCVLGTLQLVYIRVNLRLEIRLKVKFKV